MNAPERHRADSPALPPIAPPTPIDPEIKRFVDAVGSESRRLIAGRTLGWPELRPIYEQARLPWRQGGPVMARTEEVVADTAAGPVRLRIHDPDPGRAKPTLVYLHGGGWTIFSIDTHDRLMREYAHRGGLAVVGVDYALAPEARYPVALEQCIGVVRWLGDHGAALGLDAGRLALGGDSAGGALSFGTALKLRDAGEGGRVRAILSNYGGFGPDCSEVARRRYGTPQDMLSSDEVDEFWNTYLRSPAERTDPYATALLAPLQGLPPVFLAIAECDVLAEQNLQMAGLLLAAKVPVEVELYAGAPHSFLEAMSVSETARRGIEDGARWLRRTLDGAG